MNEALFLNKNVYLNYYTVYKNWRLCCIKYRKHRSQSEEIPFDNFVSTMQSTTYVIDESTDSLGNNVLCYIFYIDSPIIQASAKMKLLLKSIKSNKHIVFILPKDLRNHHIRAIENVTDYVIHCYKKQVFSAEIPRGPGCGTHSVLNDEEKINICNNEIFTWASSLSRILVTDPQLIWINAKVADIVKISRPVDQGGEFIQYRIVIPAVGSKPMASVGETTATTVAPIAEESDDDDEPIAEESEEEPIEEPAD
jgi:hypothetical protein